MLGDLFSEIDNIDFNCRHASCVLSYIMEFDTLYAVVVHLVISFLPSASFYMLVSLQQLILFQHNLQLLFKKKKNSLSAASYNMIVVILMKLDFV